MDSVGRLLRRYSWRLLWPVVILVISSAVDGPAVVARVELPPAGMSAVALNDMFRTYGDTSGEWNGGDSTVSVPLPDGRLVWLFSDTFVGPLNANGTRPTNTPMVHNSLVLQDGTQLVDTLTSGSAQFPQSFVGGDRDLDTDNAGYWVGDGTVEGSTLKVLYGHYRKTGMGGLDVELTGTWLATFDLPTLSLRSLVDRQLGAKIAWGSAILEDDEYTYIYGSEFGAEGMKFAHVARAAARGIDGAWQYWTGSAWSDQPDESARVMSGVGTGYAVQRIVNQYVLVTMDSNLVFNPTVVAYAATSPVGPFTGPMNLYTAPEVQPGQGVIVYDTRLHAALARPGKLLVSYNVNSLATGDNYADARLYRPRFIEVDWPPPTPTPGTVPASPTNLTAHMDDDGVVHLAWTASNGASRYWVYQQDLTAGQTHVARIPGSTEQTLFTLAMLQTNHTYQFTVSAENAQGEGERSTVVSITPSLPQPPVPTGVTASANLAGKVTVSWSAAPKVWRYQVFRRDITAGESVFTGMAKVSYEATSQELEWLVNNHEYELYVVAENGGGSSPPSAAVRVTVRYDPPPAPPGLAAASNADGTITLTWTGSGTGLWHLVYQRDVTAGETGYTKLPLPVTTGTEVRAGFLKHEHVYAFAITAVNGGGESPKSAPAQATARYAAPLGPANLRAAAGDGQVTLTWEATATDHWYYVYQRDVTAAETEFVRLPFPVTDGVTATPGYLSNGHMYEFAVSAINSGGVEGPRSTPVRVTPNVPLPGGTTGLVATAKTDGTIMLTWDTPTANVWHWIYLRDITANQEWQRLPYPVTEGSHFTAGLLSHGHIYEFKVAAINSAGEGSASDVASAVSWYDPPPAPTNLSGNPNGDGSIDLEWTAPAPNLFYWVYHRDVTASEVFTRSVYPTDKITATLGALRHDHIYEFKVSAENPGGEGPTSATIQVTAYGGLPAAPTNLAAAAGDGKVTLSWTASSSPNVYYWVEYRTSSESWRRLQYPVSTCCTFAVEYLTNGTTYEFRVRATNIAGDGTTSEVVTAQPMPPFPQPPSGLSAAAGDGKVTLSWTTSSTSNVYYWIEYRTSGNWQRLQHPVSICCTFAVEYLTNGTTYEFRVRATNIAGDSAPSNVASTRPMPPFPQPPSNLSVRPGLGKVTLQWTASPTANVYYWVEYQPSGDSWQRAVYPVPSCCTFTLDYLTADAYTFRVRATNAAGDSSPSNTVSAAMPLPPAPTGFNAEQAGPYQAKLTWNAVPGADAYIIYHAVAGDIWSFPEMKPLPYPIMNGKTTNFTVSYLTQVGIHYFGVAAAKYGRTGPMSTRDTMVPLMENWDYFEARWRYFDGPVPEKDSRRVTRTHRTSIDSGIVVVRAFIDTGYGVYFPISDGLRRAFEANPYASARIHVVWDTGRAELAALAQASCTLDVCVQALPISFSSSSADDTEIVFANYVWWEGPSGDNLTFHWKASNSVTSDWWLLSWHIDTTVNMRRTNGQNYSAELHTDHFPSYEVYQYPHYTPLGFPEARTLLTCGQYQIDGLTDSLSERRWCR